MPIGSHLASSRETPPRSRDGQRSSPRSRSEFSVLPVVRQDPIHRHRRIIYFRLRRIARHLRDTYPVQQLQVRYQLDAVAIVLDLPHPMDVAHRLRFDQANKLLGRQSRKERQLCIAVSALVSPKTHKPRNGIANRHQRSLTRGAHLVGRVELHQPTSRPEFVPVNFNAACLQYCTVEGGAPAFRWGAYKHLADLKPTARRHQYLSASRASASCSAVTLQ